MDGKQPAGRRMRKGGGSISHLLRCIHCEYQAKQTYHLKRHLVQHETKFSHQCPHCSFSARSQTWISIHLKHHHHFEGQNKFKILSDSNKPKEWYEAPSGTRKKYLFCSDCNYKNTSYYYLMRHIIKKHPSSAPFQDEVGQSDYGKALGWTLYRCSHCEFASYKNGIVQRHMEHHEKKAAHQCHRCNYSANMLNSLSRHLSRDHSENNDANITDDHDEFENLEKETTTSSNSGKREEFYYDSSGKKRRYIFCRLCVYKALTWKAMGSHVKVMHPSSTTAHPVRPPIRIAGIRIQCADCDYGTCVKRDMRVHMERHVNKSTYQCRLCSYSVPSYGHLVRHLKKDHSRKMMESNEVEDNESDDVSEVDQSRVEKEKYYVQSSGLRLRFKFCFDCDYETTSWSQLRKHVSIMHPSSTKTFVLAPQKRTGRPTRIQDREEDGGKWFYRPNGSRTKYKFCKDCDFKTDKIAKLRYHIKSIHPNSTKAMIIPRKIIRRCCHCNHTALSIRALQKHQKFCYEKRKVSYHCHLCCFVTESLARFGIHVKNHFRKYTKQPCNQAPLPLESGLKNRFSLRECRVILQDISPSISEPTRSASSVRDSNSCRKSMAEIRSIRLRMEAMEKKVRIADEELKQITSKRKSVIEKIQEITTQKVLIEKDLLLERESTEKRDQLNNLEGELLILRLEEKNLFEDLGDAEGTYIGATQVLLALQSDLEQMESDCD